MIEKRICQLLLFLAISIHSIKLTAQEKMLTVRGTVIGADDNFPIPGASVIAEGTLLGTSTDFDGNFELSIPDSIHIINVSFIGMRTQEIDITGQTEITVLLESDLVGIEEVIVTVPYSKQSKDSYSGSVTVIRTKQMDNHTPESIDKVLQGAAPGVMATSPSGQPGSQSEIRLRGTGSLSAGSAPLYIIDGVPANSEKLTNLTDNGNTLASINPSDIESISILKDAAATSLYGSRASNGVIMITTKQGKSGKTRYNFSASSGISQISNPGYRMMNTEEYLSWKTQAMINAGFNDIKIAQNLESDTIYTNWMDEVYRLGINQNYELSTSGGNEKTQFFLSGRYRNDEGIVIGTDYTTVSGRINLTHQASEKIEIGTKSSIALSTQNGTPGGGELADPVTAAYLIKPTIPVYNQDGSYYFDNQTQNPVGIVALDRNESKTNRYFGNVYAQYTVIPDLKIKSIVSSDLINVDEFKFQHPQTPDGQAFNGVGTAASTKVLDLTSSNTATYSKAFKHKQMLTAIAGYEIQSKEKELLRTQTTNFGSSNLSELSTASQPLNSESNSELERIVSYFTNFQYSLKDKYYLSGSVRRDGSSKFSEENKYANFWSVGGSWRVSEEAFLANAQNINNLKLRGSYGTSGNSDIDNYAYETLFTYSENYDGNPGGAATKLGNDELTWEKNANADIGVDMRFFQRFTSTIEVYHRKTFDLLLDVPISMTSGYTSQLQNVGEMRNMGVEFSFGAELIHKNDFSWSIDFNISHNSNKILKLYQAEDIINGSQVQREGESYNSFYLADYLGVDSRTGEPIWQDSAGNVTKDYSKAQRYIAGSPDPLFTSGISNSFSYKNIELSCLFFISYGNDIYNNLNRALISDGAFANYNQSTEALDYWSNQTEDVFIPKPVYNNTNNSNASSDRYLEDGSFIRLKNLSMSYTIPNEKLNESWTGSLRIFAQATNLWTLTNYSGIDPEQNLRGVEFFSYPKARTFSLGLKLSF